MEHERYTKETLLIACRYGQSKIVREVLASTGCHFIPLAALKLAAKFNHLGTLKLLASVLENDEKEFSINPMYDVLSMHELLIVAVIHGDEPIIKFIVARLNPGGSRPKMWYTDKVDSLTGRTALELAASNGRHQIIHLLYDTETGGPYRYQYWLSALPLAIEGGFVETVNVLMRLGFELAVHSADFYIVLKRSIDGKTALYKAATNGSYDIMKTILEKCVDPTIDPPSDSIKRKKDYGACSCGE